MFMKINFTKRKYEYTYVYFERVRIISGYKKYLGKHYKWVDLKDAYIFSDNPVYNKPYTTGAGSIVNYTLEDACRLKKELDNQHFIHNLILTNLISTCENSTK